MQNSVETFTDKIKKYLLIDLKNTHGFVVMFTAIQIYKHIHAKFLLPRDISQEIDRTNDNLQVVYNPNNIIQVLYKKIRLAVAMLNTLNQAVPDVEIMQQAFKLF